MQPFPTGQGMGRRQGEAEMFLADFDAGEAFFIESIRQDDELVALVVQLFFE